MDNINMVLYKIDYNMEEYRNNIILAFTIPPTYLVEINYNLFSICLGSFEKKEDWKVKLTHIKVTFKPIFFLKWIYNLKFQ